MTDQPLNENSGHKTLDANAVRRVAEGEHADRSRLRRFLLDNRPALGSLLVFVLMITLFFIGNPTVFSQWSIYRAVLIGLPVVLFVVVPLVFVVTVGEIDPVIPGHHRYVRLGLRTRGVQASGYDPFLG